METFYRALFPPDCNIFGYSLKPFSYWHLTLLRALESPFIDEDGQATSADLITALKVCSLSYPSSSFTYTKKDKFKAWLLSKIPANLHSHCVEFAHYYRSHQYIPEFWEMEENGGNWTTASAPAELSTVVHLVKSGFKYHEAWNMSIGESNWISATLLEQAGNPRRFLDPYELRKMHPEENLNDKTEEELYLIAVEDLGEERAQKWLKARQENKKL